MVRWSENNFPPRYLPYLNGHRSDASDEDASDETEIEHAIAVAGRFHLAICQVHNVLYSQETDCPACRLEAERRTRLSLTEQWRRSPLASLQPRSKWDYCLLISGIGIGIALCKLLGWLR